MAMFLRRILVTLVIYVLYYLCLTYTQDVCDPYNGPESERCVYIPGYDDFQMARCTTPTNVSILTNGTFRCVDSCRNYCWLSCMTEQFSQKNGSVHANCFCANDTSWCSRVSGSCTFFPQCLVPKLSNCNPTPSSVDLSNTLCEAVTIVINGEENCTVKEWMRDFRVCIHRDFVPKVYLNDTLTCDGVKDTGYQIVERCIAGLCDVSKSTATYIYGSLDAFKYRYPADESDITGIQQQVNCTT